MRPGGTAILGHLYIPDMGCWPVGLPKSGASTSVLHWGLGEGAPAMGVAGEIKKLWSL